MDALNTLINNVIWNYIALAFFILVWVGYSYFAKYMAKRTHCLASVLDLHRVSWMERMMLRDNRIGDAALLANLERNVNFMASTTVIIVAAVLTALSSSNFEWLNNAGSVFSQYKLGLILFIMVYAFFLFYVVSASIWFWQCTGWGITHAGSGAI